MWSSKIIHHVSTVLVRHKPHNPCSDPGCGRKEYNHDRVNFATGNSQRAGCWAKRQDHIRKLVEVKSMAGSVVE